MKTRNGGEGREGTCHEDERHGLHQGRIRNIPGKDRVMWEELVLL